MMNLAVMSDLHIGLAARAKDLCPQPPPIPKKDRQKYDRKTDSSYKQKFVDFVQREGITADYLILPGDITDSAQPLEVQLASDFVLQAANALHVPQNKIIFVPGNHDVDWSVFDAHDSTGVRWGQRYDPIGHKNFQFKKIVDEGCVKSLLSDGHFNVWEFEDLIVVGYNSASCSLPILRSDALDGLADPVNLNAIRQYLGSIGPSDGRLRLFLVHHHPLGFNTTIPSPDFRLMKNAESLIALLHKCSFDILIHGHKHHPRFETLSTQTYPHLPILCSGSFSVEIDTQWAGTIDNQFHLVTVDGRAGSENCITGKITSWTNNHFRGWIPSEELTSGIHHVIPFGSYVMPQELDARLEPFITKWLTTHTHILWREVVQEFPDLGNLPADSAIAAFERMARKPGRQSMYQNLKDLILYTNGD